MTLSAPATLLSQGVSYPHRSEGLDGELKPRTTLVSAVLTD